MTEVKKINNNEEKLKNIHSLIDLTSTICVVNQRIQFDKDEGIYAMIPIEAIQQLETILNVINPNILKEKTENFKEVISNEVLKA
jgi:hypothetical protein